MHFVGQQSGELELVRFQLHVHTHTSIYIVLVSRLAVVVLTAGSTCAHSTLNPADQICKDLIGNMVCTEWQGLRACRCMDQTRWRNLS